MTTITNSLQSSNHQEIIAALECFIEFLNSNQLSHNELTIIYPFILPHLYQSQTIASACAALEEIIERSSGITTSTAGVTRFMSRSKTEELVTNWVASQVVAAIITAAVTEQEVNEEINAVMRLLCAIGEHFVGFLFIEVPPSSSLPSLTLSSPSTLHLLQLILAITLFPGHESYQTNELGNGVWLALQEECSDIGLVKGSGDGREGREGKEADWQTVESIFVALANGLRLRCEWPKKEVLDTWPKGQSLQQD